MKIHERYMSDRRRSTNEEKMDDGGGEVHLFMFY